MIKTVHIIYCVKLPNKYFNNNDEKIIPSKIDFKYDLKKSNFLSECIKNKNILVGGAGTIGSNYIKEILKFDLH